MSGGGETGGTPEQSAITISLAGIKGSRQAQPQQSDAQLQLLYRKVLSERAEVYASDKRQPRQQASLAKLFDAIEHEHSGAGGQGSTGHDQGADSPAGKPDAKARNAARAPQPQDGPGATASSGDLWGEIEPCWRRLPDQSRVRVTLDIELDDSGRIARPPTIVRPTDAAPNETRLIAEARALAAITACVPYHSEALLGGRRGFRVDFIPRSSAKPD